MLTAMAGKVERVFFVGLPTSRVLHNEWAAAYASRNAAMKVQLLPWVFRPTQQVRTGSLGCLEPYRTPAHIPADRRAWHLMYVIVHDPALLMILGSVTREPPPPIAP